MKNILYRCSSIIFYSLAIGFFILHFGFIVLLHMSLWLSGNFTLGFPDVMIMMVGVYMCPLFWSLGYIARSQRKLNWLLFVFISLEIAMLVFMPKKFSVH
jgi:hypothetical protein